MKKQDHSYLDLSVLPQLRTRVLSSDAVVLFNHDLSNILWANANGAKLFGGRGVVDLLDLNLGDQHALIKQLKNTISQMNDSQSIVRGFRLNQGLRSVLLQFEIKKIELPGNDIGYQITSHADEHAQKQSENQLAIEAVDSLLGFADAAAILDDYGLPLAASHEFEALGPSETILNLMIQELQDEEDRLIKRPEPNLNGNIVAIGLARLTDQPGRNLIVLADTNQPAQPAQIAEPPATPVATPAPVVVVEPEPEPIEEPVVEPQVKDNLEQSLFTPDSSISGDDFGAEDDFGTEDMSLFADPDAESTPTTLEPDINTADLYEAVTSFSIQEESDETPSLDPSDEALTRHNEDQFIPASGISPNEDAMEDVRFSWVTDTQNFFTSVSPELETAVGAAASALVGRKWREIAAHLGIDEHGEIAKSLETKETWSGKSVLWPVTNTDMLLPIDLAALPTFGTNKDFQGFRGFGVIRQLDAIVDPEARGLKLSTAAPALSKSKTPDVDISNVVPLVEDKDNEASKALNTQESSNFKIIGETLQGMDNIPSPTDDFTEEHAEVEEILETVIEPEVEDAIIEQKLAQIDTSLIANLPVAVLIHKSNELLHTNKKLLEITGYENLEDIIQAGGLDALLNETDIEDEEQSGKQAIITKSGAKIAISPVLQSVPWHGDKAYMLSFAIEQDVLFENDHSFELANSQEIQNILDTASDGIIVMDEEGLIDSINSSTEALLGWTNEEASGKSVVEFFAPESKDTVIEYLETVSTPGIDSLLNDGRDLIANERNGGLIPIFLTITKMESSNKYCAVVRDMTSWKKVEEELVSSRLDAERASDQKTNFLAHVSHEIRTPLNAIIGFSDVMLKERFGPVDNERYREYLQDIKRSGAHVLDLVNDLLDLSKIEAGKLDLSFEAVELNKLVSETVALLQPQANTSRIIIRTSLSKAVPKVVADTRSMRQIILNLVSNAIKFSTANSQVIVSTLYEANGEVALRVRDTGPGMNASEIEEALKPFHQLQNVAERKNEGTGLGLPLTKALVEANRAHFDIESMPGQGTIVHMQFPIQRVLTD